MCWLWKVWLGCTQQPLEQPWSSYRQRYECASINTVNCTCNWIIKCEVDKIGTSLPTQNNVWVHYEHAARHRPLLLTGPMGWRPLCPGHHCVKALHTLQNVINLRKVLSQLQQIVFVCDCRCFVCIDPEKGSKVQRGSKKNWMGAWWHWSSGTLGERLLSWTCTWIHIVRTWHFVEHSFRPSIVGDWALILIITWKCICMWGMGTLLRLWNSFLHSQYC